ncbi:hypothetical protein SOJ30_03595, partial [Treponema pallidum]
TLHTLTHQYLKYEECSKQLAQKTQESA